MHDDSLKLGDRVFSNRLFTGTGKVAANRQGRTWKHSLTGMRRDKNRAILHEIEKSKRGN